MQHTGLGRKYQGLSLFIIWSGWCMGTGNERKKGWKDEKWKDERMKGWKDERVKGRKDERKKGLIKD